MTLLARPLLLTFLTIYSGAALAFHTGIEFHHFSEAELDSLGWPERVDAEYYSDQLTFQSPILWEENWRNSNKALEIGIGSVGSKEFSHYRRFKVEESLSQSFGFHFNHFRRNDYEDDFAKTNIAFSYGNQAWRVFGNGEAQHEKDKNDLGLAAQWTGARHRIKAFHNWIDFDRHKRNRQTDRFLDKPEAFGLVYELLPQENKYLMVSWRQQNESQWVFPDSGRVYAHQSASFSLLGRYGQNKFYAFWDEKFESDDTLSVNISPGNPITQLWRQRAELDWRVLCSSWEPGLRLRYRQWRSAGGDLSFQIIQPYLGYHFSPSWLLQYEHTQLQPLGPGEIGAMEWPRSQSENRFNAFWSHQFSATGTLRFAFTADLDELLSGNPWEGGFGGINWVF